MFDAEAESETRDDLSGKFKSPSQLSVMRDKMSTTENAKAISRKNILGSSVLTSKNARNSSF